MRTLLTVTALSSALALAAACGGKKGSTTPDDVATGGGDDSGEAVEDPCAGAMCPPETLDAIQRALAAKRRAAARCLSDAVNDGKASRDARGHVALSFKITPSGKAQDIQVVQSSIKNPDVEQCVVAEVQQIVFEKVPTTLDWSYTYAFESM